jgi:hypothetical protein
MKLRFFLVIPANAGIQYYIDIIHFSGFRVGARNDEGSIVIFLCIKTLKFHFRLNRHAGGSAGFRQSPET